MRTTMQTDQNTDPLPSQDEGQPTEDVHFVSDAPSGLPVYFGQKVRAVGGVLPAHEDDHDDVTKTNQADPDVILSSAVSEPEAAIDVLRNSTTFANYKTNLAEAQLSVRDAVRKAYHPDVLHALSWDMQQLDKVSALPEMGQLSAWLWARLVYGRGFAILTLLSVVGGILWSVWIIITNR